MQRFLRLCCLLTLPFSGFTQPLFSDVARYEGPSDAQRNGRTLPESFRLVRLESAHLRQALAAAPLRFGSARGKEVVLSLPMPDGRWARFRVAESPVMPPALQDKYPDIRTYTGVGIDDPTASLKCDLTPRGFHAAIFSAQHEPVFFDPYPPNASDHAMVYFKSALKPPKEPWKCSVDEAPVKSARAEGSAPEVVGDCQLRRYRLALACTGEYAQFQGGTKPLALAAMVTTLNRVNGIYERDLGIVLELVPNNDTLIFLNPDTDGYSNNNSSMMLLQNVAKCNALIGPENYDIGHVFSTGGGGIAGLRVVCNDNTKARGVTGRPAPVGDPFDIDYVAHEMGHQFGANHTQNNSCNRNDATAVEPGSGSTIMGHSGICSPNVQNNSDDYFHAISLQEIRQYTALGAGDGCAQKLDINNHAPTVAPVGGMGFTIPHSTPFVLTAEGEDADSDVLTYCWEQMDNPSAPMPPQPSNVAGPMFRSLKPTASPERYFPSLDFLVANAINSWECLPAVERTLRFQVTVRDNHLGGGCTAFAEVSISVAGDSGPFKVLQPNADTVWYVGQVQTVRWDVARTDTAPVNCAEVILRLSTDGGWTYPHLLAGPVPNTGEAQIKVPLLLSDSCRVRVQAVGNVFFDISDQNFRIELPPVPDFRVETSLPNAAVQRCVGDSLAFWVHTRSIGGFSGEVTLAFDGLPPGATAAIVPSSLLSSDSAFVVIGGLTAPGQYALSLVGTSDTLVRKHEIALQVVGTKPPTPTLATPLNGQRGITPESALQWTSADNVLYHHVQVARNPAFHPSQIAWETSVVDTEAFVSSLQPNAVYYWRVRAENACGQSEYSPVWAFQTAQPACGFEFTSEEVPADISSAQPTTVTSSLLLSDPRPLAEVAVWMNLEHTWVGDLRARLIRLGVDTVVLFDQPGVPASPAGCPSDDISATFNDNAALTATDFENTCNAFPPAISGEFRPLETLQRFYLKPASGTWLLEVTDLAEEDGGAIKSWGMRCCFWDSIQNASLLKKETLLLAAGQTATVDSTLLALDLSGQTPENGLFTLTALPQHGQLLFKGLPLAVGNSFTQADIDHSLIAYAHNGNTATQDAFAFDALHVAGGQWLHDAVFHIQIAQNDLEVSLTLLDSLRCHNAADARLLVSVLGGKPPYSYQLSSGGMAQESPIFENLGPGTYAVIVTDAWGFTAVSPTVIVPNPAPIAVQLIASNDSVFVQASGGHPPYWYRVGEGNYQQEPIFAGLPNGTYAVDVLDAEGCTATAQVIVYVGPLAVLDVQTQPVSCYGDSNGMAQVIAGGGLPPYAYSLDGTNFQWEKIFENLPAGEYIAVVKDKSGTTTTQNFSIDQPSVLEVSAWVVLNRIEVMATGGTGALLYRLNGGPFQQQPVFSALPNGTYTVTVQDANGCTAEVSVLVEVPPLQLLTVEIVGQILCAGQTVRVLASAEGGVPPYTYALDAGDFQTEGIWEAVGAGPHAITVRDAAGHQISSNTFSIPSPDKLEVTAVVFGPTASVLSSGGTPPYRFALDDADWTSEQFFASLSRGIHWVVVADANDCTDTVFFEIDYAPMTILLTRTPPSCAGASDGLLEVEILGGLPPFTCNGAPLSDNRCVQEHLSAGAYSIALTDAVGDTLVFSAILDDPPALAITASAALNTLTATASGGTGALLYSLDGLTFQHSPIFPDLPDGTYTVTVRDANGCTAVSEPVVINTISTRALYTKAQIRLYPNPNSGHFWLELRQPGAAEALLLSLYDMCGQLVWQQRLLAPANSEGWEIHLTEMPEGAYLLQGTDLRLWFVERLILTKGRE